MKSVTQVHKTFHEICCLVTLVFFFLEIKATWFDILLSNAMTLIYLCVTKVVKSVLATSDFDPACEYFTL